MANEGLTDRGNITIRPDGRTELVRLREMAAACVVGWDDVQVLAQSAAGAGALTVTTFRDTGMPVLSMSSAADDTLGITAQMPHRWNKGDVRPHIHWAPLGAPAAPRNVRFTGLYVWSIPGVEIPAAAGWTPFTIDVPLVAGDENEQAVTSLGLISPPAFAQIESSLLLIKLTRNGLSAADDYTDGGPNNLGILSLDTHFQAVKHGTLDELPTMG